MAGSSNFTHLNDLLDSSDTSQEIMETRDGIPLTEMKKDHLFSEEDKERSVIFSKLRFSIETRDIYELQKILEQRTDVKSILDDSNSIHAACKVGDVNILYLLITRGGDVNRKDAKGRTPTRIAVKHGNEDCINILATAGANIDEEDVKGRTPLMIAARDGQAKMVRELMKNSESYYNNIDDEDNTIKKALELAIEKNNDEAAANIIRLGLKEKYLKKYIKDLNIGLLVIVRQKMRKTLRALLDHALIQDPDNSHKGKILTEYIDYDPSTDIPGDKKQVFLKRIQDLGDEDITYSGTVRILVERKMGKIGNYYLAFKILFHFIYFVALAYSLIVATNENAPRDSYTRNAENIIRIIAEIYVLIYFVYNFFGEGKEIFAIYRNVTLLNEEMGKKKATTIGERIGNGCSVFKDILADYFSDTTNYFDLVGHISVLILIFLRLGNQPLQWEFATIANLINALRLFQLVALIPFIGPYANIFFQILKSDVPQFVGLYSLYLCMFATSYFIALRVPYTIEGLLNQTLMQDTDRVAGVDDTIYWMFLTSARILLEGNIYDDVYTYRHLNWSAALLYMSFLFLTVVVFLNIFIAQLSDTYSSVKENAQRAYSWHRLSFILLIQHSSLLACFQKYKRCFYYESISVDTNEMYKYYGVNSIKTLDSKHYTEDVEVKQVLDTILNQQNLARQTREISKNYSKVQQKRLKDKGAEKLNELSEKVDNLTESLADLMKFVKERLK